VSELIGFIDFIAFIGLVQKIRGLGYGVKHKQVWKLTAKYFELQTGTVAFLGFMITSL
jgi:hypothetical protein